MSPLNDSKMSPLRGRGRVGGGESDDESQRGRSGEGDAAGGGTAHPAAGSAGTTGNRCAPGQTRM